MKDSLFIEELPIIENYEEFKTIKEKFSSFDEYYVASGSYADRREKFEKLWGNFAPYADSNFKLEIQQNFHSRSWEMYTGNILLYKKLISTKNLKSKPKNEGPDFILDDGTYIECIACTKGDPKKDSSVKGPVYSKKSEVAILQDLPIDKMILRITQAFKDKAFIQYKKWKNKKWFNSKAPFIIAINSADLEWPQNYLGIPLIIKALFGLEFLLINQEHKESFSWRNKIQKGEGVPVNYFTVKDFDFVSGVIFSDLNVLNHPENIGEDCIYVNNPLAKNPSTKDISDSFSAWIAENNKLTKRY